MQADSVMSCTPTNAFAFESHVKIYHRPLQYFTNTSDLWHAPTPLPKCMVSTRLLSVCIETIQIIKVKDTLIEERLCLDVHKRRNDRQIILFKRRYRRGHVLDVQCTRILIVRTVAVVFKVVCSTLRRDFLHDAAASVTKLACAVSSAPSTRPTQFSGHADRPAE